MPSACSIAAPRHANGSATELPGLTAVIDADVSDFEQVQAAVGEAIERMGSLDVVINNAGISIRHDFLDITPEEWDEVLGVNLKGVFQVAQAAARHMVARGSGVILNTASTGGSTGYPALRRLQRQQRRRDRADPVDGSRARPRRPGQRRSLPATC